MAEKFILHVETLFATIDDLETFFTRLSSRGELLFPPFFCKIVGWLVIFEIDKENQLKQGCHMYGKLDYYAVKR